MKIEKTYFPELDGLRFIAFLLVFIQHAPLISANPVWVALHNYGWMGVDLFLCLSAFLFTKLLHTEHQRTGTINIPYFYVRRTLRIWPLYFVFSTLVILYTYYRAGHFSPYIWRTLGIFTFTDNLFASVLSYNPFFYAAHLWTISYEEQFYAVIPWALRKLFQLSQRTQALVLLVVVGIGFIIRIGFIWAQVPHPAIWVLPITHFDSIIFGLIIGLGLLDPILKKIPWPVTGLAGMVALVEVCRLPNVFVITWNLMLTYSLVGIGMGLILYVTLQASNSPILGWLSSRPVAFLGKISYGLYVYHLFCLSTGESLNLGPELSWGWILAVFIIPLLGTIAISTLSYTFLEKPFLRLKERFTIVLSRPA